MPATPGAPSRTSRCRMWWRTSRSLVARPTTRSPPPAHAPTPTPPSHRTVLHQRHHRPTGGSVGCTNGVLDTRSVPLTLTLGSDAGSGLDAAAALVKRATRPRSPHRVGPAARSPAPAPPRSRSPAVRTRASPPVTATSTSTWCVTTSETSPPSHGALVFTPSASIPGQRRQRRSGHIYNSGWADLQRRVASSCSNRASLPRRPAGECKSDPYRTPGRPWESTDAPPSRRTIGCLHRPQVDVEQVRRRP